MMKDLALLVAEQKHGFCNERHTEPPESNSEFDRLSMRSGSTSTAMAAFESTGPETLALLRQQFQHGITMPDWEGSGTEEAPSNLNKCSIHVWHALGAIGRRQS